MMPFQINASFGQVAGKDQFDILREISASLVERDQEALVILVRPVARGKKRNGA